MTEVLRSAMARAEKIEADAARAAARRLDDAEQEASRRRAAVAQAQDEADRDRDRDRAAALRVEREEAIAGREEQLGILRAEAELRASAFLGQAEAEAARVREAVAEELAQAHAILDQAKAQAVVIRQVADADAAHARSVAAETMRAPEEELETAVGLRIAEQQLPSRGPTGLPGTTEAQARGRPD
ncbi:MAG: hypothetical protein ACR2LJ_00140 [Acidimicrobiales bacterium]